MKVRINGRPLGVICFVSLLLFFISPLSIWGAPSLTSWTPRKVAETMEVGAERTLKFTFTSSVKLINAELWVVPKLQPFVTVEPRIFSVINAKSAYTVKIQISIPFETQVGVYEGTIHLRVGSRTYPLPLPVELNIVSTANRPPVAVAGPDQDVAVGDPASLDGRDSHDPDGDIVYYLWTIEDSPEGSSAVIKNPNSVAPTLTPDVPGDYKISLIVNDGTIQSAPGHVVIHAYPSNVPPTADAGMNQSVLTGSTIHLTGVGSKDPEGDVLTYEWEIGSKPDGSLASLSNSTSMDPSFVPDKDGKYIVQLTVSDGKASSIPDTVTITALTPNAAPTADAGKDQTAVSRNTDILLDGTGSSDPEGDSLTYHWSIVSQPPGSVSSLKNEKPEAPTIKADQEGIFVFELWVEDPYNVSNKDTVVVTVVNDRPVADAGTDQTGLAHDQIVLDGTGSTDRNGDLLTFDWKITGGPPGYSASVSDPGLPKPSLIAHTPGTYTLALTVKDRELTSNPDFVVVTVQISVPNVVGMTQAQAQQEIAGAHLAVNITQENSSTVPGGTVIRQNPPARTEVMAGTLVSLVISLGPSAVAVPNVVGLTQAAAQSAITSASLVVGTVTRQYSDTVPPGNVISQNPAAGASASPGSTVDLIISDGPSGPVLPPDPATVAPPVNATAATSVAGSTEFLYTGSNPIQTGVESGTIEAKRAAVLRGKVLTREGIPVSGVVIRILNRGEYGQTLSRTDGMFDLVVNGGEMLTVQYSKEGFLTAQRQLSVPMQEFAYLPDVVLLQKDTRVTPIDLNSPAPVQTARGTVVTDEVGTRQAALVFPQGTTATAVLPNGSTEPLTNLSVRITEYSVGPEGPKAMPAKLPPTVGYTYCVEFASDEADDRGATEVRFSQPLFHYVHNFLNFPVGMIVPVGYYDRQKGIWVASDNGRVIRVIRVTSGLAELDTDGDLIIDNGAALGITDAERETIAGLFNAGDSLWRTPIPHFSPWDMNWGIGPPPDAQDPQQPSATPADQNTVDNPSSQGGWGSLQIENQAFHEEVPVAGTPFKLHYQSDRVEGRRASYTMEIPLSGLNVPDSLKRIDLEIYVAGQRHSQTFGPGPGQATSFTWNGQDAYGRALQGSQPIHVKVGFVYTGVYQYPVDMPQTFGRLSGVPISASLTRQEITLWQEHKAVIGSWNALLQGLGGWTLNVHHAYDPISSVLFYGDGSRYSARSVSSTIATIAGNGTYILRDGVPATESGVNSPMDVALKPDGSFYTSDSPYTYAYPGKHIRYVDTNGLISTIAGPPGNYSCTYDETGYNDGIPSIDACLYAKSFAVGPDGNLYVASDQRVRRIGPDGIITTVAGVHPILNPGFSGDGGPATEAQLNDPQGFSFAPDGSLYIADNGNRRVRHVASDGIITTVAGNGEYGCTNLCACGDGGPAQNAALVNPVDVAVGPDGNLYIAEYSAIRKVGPDGILSTVICGLTANASGLPRSWEEGIPAGSSFAGRIRSIKFGPDGSLYFAACDEKYGTGTDTYCFIRRIGTDGMVNTIVGGVKGYSGDGSDLHQAQINIAAGNGGGIDIGADGSIYIADSNNGRVRVVRNSLPGVDLTEALIPSRDGKVLHKFGPGGRHLETTHALTGSLLHQFTYDTNGRLIQITDGSGNRTAIERDSAGNPLAIIGPYRQRTGLGLHPSGYLATVTNPASEEFQFGYGDGGLLSKVTTPRGNEYRLTYDAMGRLIRADDPSSGSSALALAAVSNGDQVTLTTAMDRLSSYRRELLPSGDRRRVSRFPDGASLQVLTKVSGSSETTTPSGVTVNQMEGSDPRFGILAPYSASLVINTPGGLNYQRTGNRTVSLADPNNVLSITGETETMTVNGQVYTMTYDGGTKTFREVTPLGRRITSRIDDKGRLVWRQVDGLVPWTYGYDERGRLSVITAGEGDAARTASVTYGPDGYLERITDPLARIFRFERDTAGRVVKKILPGGGQVLYGYDANGNLTAVTPPGRPGHFFAYTPVDLQSQYTWPQVGSENNHTGYLFNLDRQLRRFEWPDGQAMDLGYDSAGRLITASGGSPRDYSYFSPATGNLAGVTTPNQDLSFSYDGTLLVSESWSGTVAGTVGRTYNNNFKPASIRVNEGPPVQFQYDIDNLLTAAGDLILTRNSQNSLITQTRIGNVADFRSYDGFAAIEDYRAAYSGADIYAVQYTRDKLGRITGKTETISGMTDSYQYLYDPAGRLGEVKKNGVTSAQYAYDENGNRLTYSDSVGTVTGGYDAQDRLTQYGSAAFGYTAKGELRSKTVGTQTDSYQYDALGNLAGVTLPDGTQIEYVVDGRNRRVGKKVNGTLVQAFLYKDALKPIAELDGSGNLISLFVYGSKSNVADYMVKGGNTYRIISDHLGSPRMVVEVSTGAVVQRMDYDEFGKVIQNTSPGFQPFGFAGGIYDPDTGLVSFGAREYDSETGRWTKKDPIGFNGRDTNLYAYVQNDPMNFIDPAGLMKGGSMTAPFANPPILLGVGGGLGSFEYSYQTGYEEIMNAIGDWLYEIYIQQGYGPGEAQMMVAQAVMEDFLHSSAGELNLPTSPPLENRLTSGEVLR